MKEYVIGYFTFLVPMLAIDSVWLFTTSKRLYAPRIGSLLAEKPRLIPAAVFYLVYAFGATVLVVVRAVSNETGYLKTFGLGAILGFFAYATYDLTNQATLREWPTEVTVIDLIWGAALTGVVSIIAVSLTRLFA
ncbi:MAG: DUF2177 family protein [Actinomycetota bacterium]|nr:DUF2177 family protein [Actinomycetota bacterium]MDD5667059.1 DUF2177 family protein [Actinomycetota bacterium]